MRSHVSVTCIYRTIAGEGGRGRQAEKRKTYGFECRKDLSSSCQIKNNCFSYSQNLIRGTYDNSRTVPINI